MSVFIAPVSLTGFFPSDGDSERDTARVQMTKKYKSKYD